MPFTSSPPPHLYPLPRDGGAGRVGGGRGRGPRRAAGRDVDLAVAAARKAFDSGPWPKMSAAERGRLVWKLGDLIMANLDEMARLESLCTGKTLFDSGKVEIPLAA